MAEIKTLTVGGQTYDIRDPDAARIDDTVKNATKTWSSEKISEEIKTAGGAVIDDAAIVAEKTWSSKKINESIWKARSCKVMDRAPGWNDYGDYIGQHVLWIGSDILDQSSVREFVYLGSKPGYEHYDPPLAWWKEVFNDTVMVTCEPEEDGLHGTASFSADYILRAAAAGRRVLLFLNGVVLQLLGADYDTLNAVFCDPHIRVEIDDTGAFTVKPHGIDDSSVSEDASWSSKNTVDKLAPAFTESGSVVTCEPVEGYPLEVVSSIEPVQEGSGHTVVKLWRFGKNLFDGYWESGYISTTTGNNVAHSNSIRTGYIPLKPGVTYYFSLKTLLNYYPYTYDKNKSFMRYVGMKSGSFVFKAGENERYLRLAQYNDPNVYESAQLEVGSSGTSYEPYRSEEFTIDLGQTVYGGSYNWQTGVLTDQDGVVTQVEAQRIPALSGTNTIYSDTGDTTVTGRADPTAVIEKLKSAIIALGGNI